jgi:hypothetical protein
MDLCRPSKRLRRHGRLVSAVLTAPIRIDGQYPMQVIRHHYVCFDFDVREMLRNFDPAGSDDLADLAQDGFVSKNLAKNGPAFERTNGDEIHPNS